MGGDAAIRLAQPGSAAQERALAERMRSASAAEYRAVADAAESARSLEPGRRKRELARLRRELRRVRRRDYFAAAEREVAVRTVEAPAVSLEALAA